MKDIHLSLKVPAHLATATWEHWQPHSSCSSRISSFSRSLESRPQRCVLTVICTFFWRTLVAIHATGLSRSPHTPDINIISILLIFVDTCYKRLQNPNAEEAYFPYTESLNINANGDGKYYLPRLTFNNEKNRQIENQRTKYYQICCWKHLSFFCHFFHFHYRFVCRQNTFIWMQPLVPDSTHVIIF